MALRAGGAAGSEFTRCDHRPLRCDNRRYDWMMDVTPNRWTACLLLTTFLLPVVVCAAEVYRWTDERGQVHYGQRPPRYDAPGSTQNPPATSAVRPSSMRNCMLSRLVSVNSI